MNCMVGSKENYKFDPGVKGLSRVQKGEDVYKHPTILDSWLFCAVKKPVSLVGCMCYTFLSTLLFQPCKKCIWNKAVGWWITL